MNLEVLQKRKLLKKLDYIKSEYDYIKEIVNINDLLFNQAIDVILDENIELKEIYQNEFMKFEELIKGEYENIQNDSPDIIDKSPEIKKIYRDIVKKTHPDKTDDPLLSSMYIDATESYKVNDISDLYSICDKLNIDFNLSKDDIDQLNNQIEDFIDKIDFLKSTYTWKWYESTDDKKNEILLDFLKNKLYL